MGKKLLCNALLIAIGGTLLISNKNKPEFTYEYKITAASNDTSDLIKMYDVKQDFIETYEKLILTVNEEYHREAVINNLSNFIDSSIGKCEYINETIVITIGEGEGKSIEGYLKNNICDTETSNYRIFIFDLLFD